MCLVFHSFSNQNLEEGKFIIVNKLEESHEIGHWILICKAEPAIVEIFNSLGATDQDISAVKNLAEKVQFNDTAVQGTKSIKCGEFCIYVAFYRLLDFDLSLKEVLSDLFTNNYEKNDMIVSNFSKKYT